MGLGNWALEIGPWKLDPGNWALENVPLECGVHANLYPCYLKPLVLHHLGIHCPWKKDALQHWCLAENPLEKGFLEFLPLEISVNHLVYLTLVFGLGLEVIACIPETDGNISIVSNRPILSPLISVSVIYTYFQG